MSRARHKHEAGGVVDKDESPKEVYAGKGSHVEEEADERKDGGKVGHKRMKHKDGGCIEGHAGKRRLDRPGRKRGGGVGSDMHPLSSASKITNAEGHDADTGDADKGSK